MWVLITSGIVCKFKCGLWSSSDSKYGESIAPSPLIKNEIKPKNTVLRVITICNTCDTLHLSVFSPNARKCGPE